MIFFYLNGVLNGKCLSKTFAIVNVTKCKFMAMGKISDVRHYIMNSYIL